MISEVDQITESIRRFNERHHVEDISADTAAALITMSQNKNVIKSSAYGYKFSRKHERMMEFIIKNFPKADKETVSTQLVKMGYFPAGYWQAFVLTIGLCVFIAWILYTASINDDASTHILVCLLGDLFCAVITIPLSYEIK